MAEILNAEKENVLESNISVLLTQDDIPGASLGTRTPNSLLSNN